MKITPVEYAYLSISKFIKLQDSAYTIFAVSSVFFTGFYDRLISRLNLAKWENLIIIEVCFTFLFFFLALWDMWTEILASKQRMRHTPDNIVRSHKAYKTIWKLVGVFSLVSIIGALAFFTILLDMEVMYMSAMTIVVAVWFIACGIEYQSIGENIESRYGYKPGIFRFFDNLLRVVEQRTLDKIGSFFTGSDQYSPMSYRDDSLEDEAFTDQNFANEDDNSKH